jgi:hypothetical protein
MLGSRLMPIDGECFMFVQVPLLPHPITAPHSPPHSRDNLEALNDNTSFKLKMTLAVEFLQAVEVQ